MPESLASMRELTLETAAEHCTRRVPCAAPQDRVGSVRDGLLGHAYDSAAEIVVCNPQGRLLGLVNIEDLLAANENVGISQIMDASPPTIAPHIDQEIAVWEAIHHGESSLAVVDHERHFQGIIPARRILEVLLWEHHEDTAKLGGF